MRVGVLIVFRFSITTWILIMFLRRLLEQKHPVGIRTRDLIRYAQSDEVIYPLGSLEGRPVSPHSLFSGTALKRGATEIAVRCVPPSLFLIRKNGTSRNRKLNQETITTLANQIRKITNPRTENAFIGLR